MALVMFFFAAAAVSKVSNSCNASAASTVPAQVRSRQMTTSEQLEDSTRDNRLTRLHASIAGGHGHNPSFPDVPLTNKGGLIRAYMRDVQEIRSYSRRAAPKAVGVRGRTMTGRGFYVETGKHLLYHFAYAVGREGKPEKAWDVMVGTSAIVVEGLDRVSRSNFP